MRGIASAIVVLGLLAAVPAQAQPKAAAAPAASTVTNWYKQAVYDPKDAKIGSIDDVLVDKGGRITGLVMGVGGFLGIGEKNVIVPFSQVKATTKNDNKWYLVMNATKDQLTKAAGYTYDRATTTWVPDKK